MAYGRIAPAHVLSTQESMTEASVLQVRAAEYVCGALLLDECGHGRVRPQRLLASQHLALTSCLAWYPGIFKQLAPCCAGVRVEFETDAQYVELELELDSEPKPTANVLAGVTNAAGQDSSSYDSIVVEVDGEVSKVYPLTSADKGQMLLRAELAAKRAAQDTLFDLDTLDCFALPGLGEAHKVCVYLPLLRGCELGYIKADGTYINPVPARAQMLVLGDSVAQGYVATKSNTSWPQLVANKLGLDLVNQSIGAQVFQPSSLAGLDTVANELKPSYVIVALGANYRWGRCCASLVSREIELYLKGVDYLFPDASLLVLTPDTASHSAVAGSCYEQIPELITNAAQAVREKRLQEGRPSVLVASTPSVFDAHMSADSDGHPTEEGHAFLADFVLEKLAMFDCACLREFGRFGRCGACTKDINS